MAVWVGIVCFVVGANFGFLTAGLMCAARQENGLFGKKDTTK